jgi:hypothetical protein
LVGAPAPAKQCRGTGHGLVGSLERFALNLNHLTLL